MSGPPVFEARVFRELCDEIGLEDTLTVLARFLADAAADMPSPEAADFPAALRRHAHALKGTAATFGFLRLAETARDVERRAAASQEADLGAARARLVSAFEECVVVARRLSHGGAAADV
ncbi:MAG TPA: Hpt domain-containing protein [Beijerinckiaceae bacterium]|jgi:chemotaxis protein histidine kinase CheA